MAKKRTLYRNTITGDIASPREALASPDPSAYVAEVVPATFKIDVVGVAQNENGTARLVIDVKADKAQLEPILHRLRLQVRP